MFNMEQIKIHKGACYAHAQTLMLITSVWVKIQLNLLERSWDSIYLKDYKHGTKKIIMTDDAHAQISNAYNFCLS